MEQKIRLKSIALYVFAVWFLTVSGLFADEAQVDKLAAQWITPDSPGCALAVIKDGKILFKKGYGLANLEHDIPITPSTVFYSGSISKQFVAFCAALLESRGELNFDDDIRKYIPEMPDYGVPVTIRHLIHHTSGIRDYAMLLTLAGLGFGYFHTEEDVIRGLLRNQKALDFNPGDKVQYSNSGYLLLAEIVRRVSGMSFREFARKNILKPLGMKHSHFQDDYSYIIKNRASGYLPAIKGGYKNYISRFDLVGSGGLYTTVEDLFLWDQNFYHCKVGGKEVVKKVLSRGTLNNHREIGYAFGLVHSIYKGLETVQHTGSMGGYRAMMLRFPGQRFSVICLSNFSSFDVVNVCQKVADIYLEDQFKAVPTKNKNKKKPGNPLHKLSKPIKPVSPTIEYLQTYTGEFFSEELNVTYEFVIREEKLYVKFRNAPDFPLTPTIKDEFTLKGIRFHFFRDDFKKGKVIGFMLSARRVENIRFGKVTN